MDDADLEGGRLSAKYAGKPARASLFRRSAALRKSCDPCLGPSASRPSISLFAVVVEAAPVFRPSLPVMSFILNMPAHGNVNNQVTSAVGATVAYFAL
jgi:hypothetical protein